MHRIDIFLQFFSFIYLSAFSSLLIQSKGLYGNNGILPTRLIVANNPNLFIRYLFPETSSHSEDLNCLILLGVIISSLAFIFESFQSKTVFLSLWIIYFTIFQIGQTFLWFQWDILLLETGVIAVILSRKWFYGKYSDKNESDSSSLGFWLVKWLIFRLMFMSGVVKLLSDCPTWWGLTALNWHYESQCIPTHLAWFAHQLPGWFQKLSVVATFVIEIGIPILFFVPIKPLQWFCFFSQLLFQICIIFSGNYNFFNLLTIALCFSLLPRRKTLNTSSKVKILILQFKRVIEDFLSILIIVLVFYKSGQYFGIQINVQKKLIDSEIKFSQREFREFLQSFVPITIYVGFSSMAYEILRLYFATFYYKGLWGKIKHFISVSITSFAVSGIFLASLVPYTQIESRSSQLLPQNIKDIYKSINSYEIVNSYGLFRRMTGVGGRPEIIIEGSNSIDGPWKEYEFMYKPGNISRAAPFLIPHQPRLDWQMWFAALGSYQDNPWLLNLLFRLLTNEKSVVQLIDGNPFPKTPPYFVRILKYTYTYTNFAQRSKHKNWWKRELNAEYLPPISLENKGFMRYINENRLAYIEQHDDNEIIKSTVKWIMNYVDQSMSHYFVWVVLATSFATKLSLNILL